jgi:hypothetical protein
MFFDDPVIMWGMIGLVVTLLAMIPLAGELLP